MKEVVDRWCVSPRELYFTDIGADKGRHIAREGILQLVVSEVLSRITDSKIRVISDKHDFLAILIHGNLAHIPVTVGFIVWDELIWKDLEKA